MSLEEEEMEMGMGFTPMQDGEGEDAYLGMTEYIGRTPEFMRAGQTSEYMRTPAG